ncbi:MAG: hypothetical protein Q7U11_15855, partial [Phenylobacterium sp.]|nr:hypothetical protein [Phenylobacterium sp.]
APPLQGQQPLALQARQMGRAAHGRGPIIGRQTAAPSRPIRRSEKAQKPPAASTAATWASCRANFGSWSSPQPRAVRARNSVSNRLACQSSSPS